MCDLPRVGGWEDLSPIVPQSAVEALRSVYRHWDDVDLFVGGLVGTRLDIFEIHLWDKVYPLQVIVPPMGVNGRLLR